MIMDYSKIKLIIWDLDETFWNGTLSEGSINIPQRHISLIKNLTDCGIINSICSKNNESDVLPELEKYGLSDFFVFKSINWDPKGKRVSSLIKNMSLRPANVLFLDDNHQNLKEVEYYNEGIMVAMCHDVIDELEKFIETTDKRDYEHRRLKQYHVLETKWNESQTYKDNEAFLRSCNIHIEILHDCINNIDRLHELLLRTNQLNYTKQRPTKDEFQKQIQDDDVTSGYVKVYDRFGDYGIVGFYLIKNAKLVHFLFSCRTIGQGVEQYVYAQLGYPPLEIIQPVVCNLDNYSCPDWITKGSIQEIKDSPQNASIHILFKGPCDMQGMLGYLQMGKNIDTEFTFTNDKGELIETHNHSAHIYGLLEWDNETKQRLAEECFFMSPDCYKSSIYQSKANIVFLSTLIEGMYGLYQNKKSNEIVAYGHYNYPITDKHYWPLYLKAQTQTYGYEITEEQLKLFTCKYEYIGRRKPHDYIEFLSFLLKKLPSNTILCLILGTELPYLANNDPSYSNRHLYHKELNNEIRIFAKNNNRIRLLEIDSAVTSQKDFSNNINHYTPAVYYKLSQKALEIIKEFSGNTNAFKVNKVRYILKQYIQPFALYIFPKNIYALIRSFGLKIAKNK